MKRYEKFIEIICGIEDQELFDQLFSAYYRHRQRQFKKIINN